MNHISLSPLYRLDILKSPPAQDAHCGQCLTSYAGVGTTLVAGLQAAVRWLAFQFLFIDPLGELLLSSAVLWPHYSHSLYVFHTRYDFYGNCVLAIY